MMRVVGVVVEVLMRRCLIRVVLVFFFLSWLLRVSLSFGFVVIICEKLKSFFLMFVLDLVMVVVWIVSFLRLLISLDVFD